ncbi:S-adenosyl-L-methionine-dependent tRNA 4-demethylwyosine synthase like protein, partial [Aduncisulcus paluster]
EKLKAMPPVTQLYLSVDAADPDTLAEIDRPYVGKTDAWRRLNESLSILSTRQERTAIRITVIKKLNCRREDIPGYVKLIRLGHPCFIELKAFSFVGGTRHRHGFFSLANVPWPDQCVEYARWLEAALEGDYSVVSVHHESKAVLMVRRDLFVGGKWVSWIDFDKFFSLYGSPDFDALSYSIPIPDDRLITPDEEAPPRSKIQEDDEL